MLSKLQRFAENLEPLNERDDTERDDDRPLITADELNEAYRTLSEFCATFDFDSVVHVAQALEGYRIPEDEATRVEAIIKAVDNFDYEMIPGIINGEVGEI